MWLIRCELGPIVSYEPVLYSIPAKMEFGGLNNF